MKMDEEPSSGIVDAAEHMAFRQRLDAFVASRDAGYTLTLDALRAGIRLRTVVDSATDVARFADEAIGIVKEEYRPSLDCKEGCAYCCCKPGVLVSVPEFVRILDHVRSAFSATDVSALTQRARVYAAQMQGRSFNEFVNDSVPCPFLDDRRCSVYAIRPLVCRGYNSTSVDACRDAHTNADYLVPIFSVIKDVTDGATVGASQCLQYAGINDALLDLGTAIGIALQAADEFIADMLTGGRALAQAENSTWVSELWSRVRELARQAGVPTELPADSPARA
jgi:Fe-S-cluster containining protein